MISSCIKHPASQRLLIIRQEYLAITAKNHCAAAILNLLEYLTTGEIAKRDIASLAGDTTATEIWLQVNQERARQMLMDCWCAKKIAAAFKLLIDLGFISRRYRKTNGNLKPVDYLFRIADVQAAIDALSATPPEQAPTATVEHVLNLVTDSVKPAPAPVIKPVDAEPKPKERKGGQIAIGAWCDMWNAAHPDADPYLPTAADVGNLTRIFHQLGDDEAKYRARIAVYLASPEPFLARQLHTAKHFYGNLNAYPAAVRDPNDTSTPSPMERLTTNFLTLIQKHNWGDTNPVDPLEEAFEDAFDTGLVIVTGEMR